MLTAKLNQVTDAEIVESRWNWLLKIGGAAAILEAVIIPIAIVVYIVSPPPTTATGYFALFQTNALLGLLALDLLLVIGVVVSIPMTLALYVTLRRVGESSMAIALALSLEGAATYFASNTSINMLSLSGQYAAATTDAQRAMFLAAGQAMLAIYTGTAFHVNYLIGGTAFLIMSFVMLRSDIFSKATAYVGIISNVMGFALYVPKIGILLSIISVVGLFIWYIMIARRLFQLGQGKPFPDGTARKK
jgi:hypothetical protein